MNRGKSVWNAEQSNAPFLLYTENMSNTTRAKLTENQKRSLVSMLSKNMPHKEIQDAFKKKFNRTVSSVSLTRLKNKHIEIITSAQKVAIEQTAIAAATLKDKSYRLLEHRMDAALEDEGDIAELRRKLRAGEISRADYDRDVQMYTQLSVTELTKIADVTHIHAKDEGGSNVPQDKAAMEMLLEGIRQGNTVQLVQIVGPKNH